jgi:hypothetical protein
MELTKKQKKTVFRRLLTLVLALALTVGLLPAVTSASTAAAAEGQTQSLTVTAQETQAEPVSSMQTYVDQAVEWGVMRGDQNGQLNADQSITRAEFVTMVNRAYGYTGLAAIPFTDVVSSDWFYEDICIAYGTGYFNGTSATTASPLMTLTREEAAVLVARNMMLDETTGEALGFSDSRELQEWSRGLIQSLSNAGVVNGYTDGSFRPQTSVSRGEVAAMLVRAIGTPVQNAGTYTLGNVYGNVTVTSSDVVLRDTTIAGDLYLTGGIGLGAVQLENVTVLGKIVVSGAGASEKADSSVLLRNVDAEALLVDSLSGQFITLRAEGDTSIATTTVRTSSYIEDMSDEGLSYIALDGDAGVSLQVAGNVKEIRDLTPNSTLTVAQGAADIITVDEQATGASVTVDNGARIKELNLDTATQVGGKGDIATLNVFAPGSIISILPDEITVRPGITADIAGQTMDAVAAAESSATPRILAGYPTVKQIAPTSAQAVFSTNKTGTVYWAVSALTDGSVTEEDLISPPVYGGKAVQSGSVQVTASNTEVTAALTGLTHGGSYYLSAVLVDGRGIHSAVKITTFTTPDDTVPAFATGYPVMTKIESNRAQVTVMPNKSCQLYYAVLPKGSVAPTAEEFKSNAVSGNLGFGVVDVVKNTTTPFWVNDVPLEELASYDLYLWLTDYDGVKSSAVTKVSFTTVDGTPPIVRYVNRVGNAKETSLDFVFQVNEPATFYWLVVEEGGNFPRSLAGQDTVPELTDTAAKVQVETGTGALVNAKGTSIYGSVKASKADTNVNFTISGLEAETSYDIYYVAKDTAGNYSSAVKLMTYSTLDGTPPTVTQKFINDKDNQLNPPADTSIQLVFSESILVMEPDAVGTLYPVTLYDKYVAAVTATGTDKTEKLEQFVNTLSDHIVLHVINSDGDDVVAATPQTDAEKMNADSTWVVDYRYVTVTRDGKNMLITFPTDTSDKSKSALNLQSGATYYFQLSGIADTSEANNYLDGTSNGSKRLDNFTTASAQLYLRNLDNLETIKYDGNTVDIHVAFEVNPHDTSMVTDDLFWDMILWSDLPLTFRLYRRDIDSSSGTAVTGEWELLTLKNKTDASVAEISTTAGTSKGISLQTTFNYPRTDTSRSYERLRAMTDHVYEYAIEFVTVNGKEDKGLWNDTVTITVSTASGTIGNLGNLGVPYVPRDRWLAQDSFASIGYVSKTRADELVIEKRLPNTKAPEFSGTYPTFSTKETSATVTLALDTNPGEVYWVVVKQGSGGKLDPTTKLKPNDPDSTETRYVHAIEVPTSGGDIYTTDVTIHRSITGKVHTSSDSTYDHTACTDLVTHTASTSKTSPELTSPVQTDIINPNLGEYQGAKSGTYTYNSSTAGTFEVTGLESSTDYYIYFVLRNGSEDSQVYLYQFTTADVETPIITLTNSSPQVEITTSTDAELWWALIPKAKLPTLLTQNFWKAADTTAPNTAVEEYRVVDAMINQVYNNGTSYFDKYAPASLKYEVYRYIHGRNDSGYWTDMGSNNTYKEKVAQTVTLNNMDPYPQEYYLVATAWNINLITTDLDVNDSSVGDAYGFKALSSVFLIDHDPPTYDGSDTIMLSFNPNKDTPVVNTAFASIVDTTKVEDTYLYSPQYYVFTGTITLHFSQPLYVIEGSKLKAVVMGESTDQAFNEDTMVSALDLLGGDAVGSCTIAQKSQIVDGEYTAADTFVFKLSGLTDGFTFTFPSTTASIANATGSSTSERVQLTFVSQLAVSYTTGFGDVYAPGFKRINVSN